MSHQAPRPVPGKNRRSCWRGFLVPNCQVGRLLAFEVFDALLVGGCNGFEALDGLVEDLGVASECADVLAVLFEGVGRGGPAFLPVAVHEFYGLGKRLMAFGGRSRRWSIVVCWRCRFPWALAVTVSSLAEWPKSGSADACVRHLITSGRLWEELLNPPPRCPVSLWTTSPDPAAPRAPRPSAS